MKKELLDKLYTRASARLVYDRTTKEILGLFKEWREENPEATLVSSNLGVVDIGKYYGIDHDKELRKELGLEEVQTEMLKRHNERETIRRKKAKEIADPILDRCEEELRNLMKKYNCDISYYIEGDTHGISEEGQYLQVEVDGFTFEREI